MINIPILISLAFPLLTLWLTMMYTFYTRKWMRWTIENERQRKAVEIILQWEGKDIADVRCRVATILGKHGQLTEKEKHAVSSYLRFFDEMALQVLSGQADEKLLKDVLRRPFLDSYVYFQIVPEAKLVNYSYIRKLYRRWRS